MQKDTFIDDLVENIKSFPITDIFEMYGIQLYRVGANYNCFSPFRENASRTSFTVSPSLNIFKDWVIPDYAGDSIKFVSLMEGISYLEAIFELGKKLELITDEEYENFFKRRRYRKDFVKNIEKKYNKVESKVFENNIAEPEILDKVFRIFISKANLSDEHLEHLKEKRNLKDEEIEKQMFFTFPTRYILRGFLKEIEEEFGSQDVLETIPGFFKRVGDKNYTFGRYKGIGIPIINAEGKIVGIQIRLDEVEEHTSRYIWFSSSFAIEDPKGKTECGTRSGSPIAVIYPKKVKYPTLFITEGVFKAISISKEFNCIALSVQGVGNWREIQKTIDTLVKKSYTIKYIFVAFDADMCYNPKVYKQAQKMTDELKIDKDFVFYVYWDIEFGKGIDDMINNGNKKSLKKYGKVEFDKAYELVIDKALEGEEETIIEKIDKNTFKKYYDKYMKLSY